METEEFGYSAGTNTLHREQSGEWHSSYDDEVKCREIRQNINPEYLNLRKELAYNLRRMRKEANNGFRSLSERQKEKILEQRLNEIRGLIMDRNIMSNNHLSLSKTISLRVNQIYLSRMNILDSEESD
ncbi:MAG: hypothetical protein WC438_00385 [Candidatus Pacearchaeota archaeon]